jgi:hypothetical protein
MRREGREGIVSKTLICSIFCVSVAAISLGADQKADGSASPQAWVESPYRNFGSPRAILGGRVLVSDEANDPALTAALGQALDALQVELHGRQGWRTPFAEGERLRIFVARKDAGGVLRLSTRARDRGFLVEPAIQIDGTGMADAEIVRQAARLYALAVLSAYGAPDQTFLTGAAAEYLSAGVGGEQDREEAAIAAAAPTVDVPAHADTLGRFYVEEFARSAGGASALRAVWEKGSETGQEVLPLLLRAFSEATGETEDHLLLRFAARFYSSVETETAPSRVSLLDLLGGALDGSAPRAFILRHRTYLPGAEAPAALRISWPEEGAPAAAVVRYRDTSLPPDVVFLSAGGARSIPLAGVARLDWVIAGSSQAVPNAAAPVSFESLTGVPFSGLAAHAAAGPEGPRIWWTTLSHEGLAGWAVFREEVLPDGRVARTGPEIVPASDHGAEPLQYAFVDPGSTPGTFYRYTIWAVTQDGTLARAFAAVLRTPD